MSTLDRKQAAHAARHQQVARGLTDRAQSADLADDGDRNRRPRVVIVGAGFGGLSAALGLARAPVDVTLIDRRNYHLFQPLLYQVATAGLAPSQIASPIRSVLRGQRNARVLMGRVIGIDPVARMVRLAERDIPYDRLVLATGARHAYFGHDEWEPFAPGLKKIDDATDIRRRILSAFERAETSEDQVERRRLLTFVVVGGGPTGVEMAGAIAELARRVLVRDFRSIDPASAHVLLVEAGPRVLATFPESLSIKAERALQRIGVDVRTGVAVTHCDPSGVTLADTVTQLAQKNAAPSDGLVTDTHLPAATVIWAAGVTASPAAKWLGLEADRAGRVIVDDRLRVPTHPEIHVIGDTAQVRGPDDKPLPGLAPVAKQQGQYVAKAIRAEFSKRRDPGPFRYRHAGSLATIGRKAAVADFGWLRVSGFVAWLLWSFVHILFLIGFRNRLIVMTDWIWSYITYQRGARLITGQGSEDN
jgi:NADH dehydrogenase